MVEPTEIPVAKPFVSIVAIVVRELDQATSVNTWLVSSEYVPVTVNCCVEPLVIEGLSGDIVIDTNVGGSSEAAVTSRLVVYSSPPEFAVIVVEPTEIPIAKPFSSIVAIVVRELDQATSVNTWLVLSEYVPVTVNCCVEPSVIEGLTGDIVIDTNVGGDVVVNWPSLEDAELFEVSIEVTMKW